MTAVIKPLSDATMQTERYRYYPLDVAAMSRQARPALSAMQTPLLIAGGGTDRVAPL